MAEYYPLISRAIANLGESTPDQRKALYARATHALLAQLRSSDPPIPEDEIDRERLSLEDAIKRTETDIAGGVDRDLLEPGEATGPQAQGMPEPQTSLRAWRAGQQPAQQERWTGPTNPTDGPDDYERVPVTEYERSGPEASAIASDRPRPPAPRTETRDRRWVRAAVIGAAIAVVVGLTAGAAIMLKHQPSDFAQALPAPARPGDSEGKFQERLSGEAPPQSPLAQAPAAAPSAPAQTPQALATPQPPNPATAAQGCTPAPGPAAPGAVLTQRAVLVEQPPDGSQDLKPMVGRVTWRLDNVSGGPGEPLDAAVRAEVDIPEAGLKVGVLIRKNRDGALPASHTLELTFSGGGEPNGGIRDVTVPEMRQDDDKRGTPLAGIAVPVKDNLFLIGLSSLPGDVQRNVELIRTRNWFMVAFRYANGRRAILLFEKGVTGERTVVDALQAWQ